MREIAIRKQKLDKILRQCNVLRNMQGIPRVLPSDHKSRRGEPPQHYANDLEPLCLSTLVGMWARGRFHIWIQLIHGIALITTTKYTNLITERAKAK